MSDSERAKPEGAERLALARLEEAVHRAVEDRRLLAGEAHEARERVRELEAILAESDAGASGAALGERLKRLERENEGLRQSVAEGREAVEELLSRLGPG